MPTHTIRLSAELEAAVQDALDRNLYPTIHACLVAFIARGVAADQEPPPIPDRTREACSSGNWELPIIIPISANGRFETQNIWDWLPEQAPRPQRFRLIRVLTNDPKYEDTVGITSLKSPWKMECIPSAPGVSLRGFRTMLEHGTGLRDYPIIRWPDTLACTGWGPAGERVPALVTIEAL